MSAAEALGRAKALTTRVLGDAWVVLDDGETELSRVHRVALAKDPEHARRLVACWNACDGVSTERLEQLPGPRETEDAAQRHASAPARANRIGETNE